MKSEEWYEFKKYIFRRVAKYHQSIIFISIRYHPRKLIFDLKFLNETFIETFHKHIMRVIPHFWNTYFYFLYIYSYISFVSYNIIISLIIRRRVTKGLSRGIRAKDNLLYRSRSWIIIETGLRWVGVKKGGQFANWKYNNEMTDKKRKINEQCCTIKKSWTRKRIIGLFRLVVNLSGDVRIE